ncbi:MAG TPA: hypothetical protein VFM79_01015 [Pelobium sp.]|nr:hypothetical protein [Pelobium sp.]
MQDYNLLINILLCLTIAAMVVLLIIMMKSLSALNRLTLESREKGKTWIYQKLYDFDADQLETLIKKIKNRQK